MNIFVYLNALVFTFTTTSKFIKIFYVKSLISSDAFRTSYTTTKWNIISRIENKSLLLHDSLNEIFISEKK